MASIGNSRNTGIGNQLARKVKSGALSQGQAQKVKNQRTLLARAFGPDWRVKVYGKGGAKGIGGPFAQREVAAKRSKALTRARSKEARQTAGSPDNGSVEAPPPSVKTGSERLPYYKR